MFTPRTFDVVPLGEVVDEPFSSLLRAPVEEKGEEGGGLELGGDL